MMLLNVVAGKAVWCSEIVLRIIVYCPSKNGEVNVEQHGSVRDN